MKTREGKQSNEIPATQNSQRGSALVIALFVMALVGVFVVLALSRTASEAAAMGNEASEGRTFYAAQASLEMMTRNFNKLFEVQLNPSATDIVSVENAVVPAMAPQFSFQQEVDQTSTSRPVVLSGGAFTGLYAIRDNWRLRATATDAATGTQVQLTRDVLNNRIPIFQFGIFYDDDLELFRPPLFSFGGRVHSNRHFFVSPGTEGVYFDSRVTAVGQIVTQAWRNHFTGDSANSLTFIKNASRADRQLLPTKGSVLNTTAGAANNIFASDPDLPPSRRNPTWPSDKTIFDGNLESEVKPLKLPLTVGTTSALIEMIKRPREIGDMLDSTTPVQVADVDSKIMRAERFANQHGLRITLADSKAKLPGCALGIGTAPVSTPCGVRLDGDTLGNGADPTLPAPSAQASRGYQPKSMKTTVVGLFDYTPTRVNGERLRTTAGQVWIKVETVTTNTVDGSIITKDVTQDILALGVTEQPMDQGSRFRISGYNHTPPGTSITATTPQAASAGTDSRSIIKLQRFLIPGPTIPKDPGMAIGYMTSFLNGSSSFNTVVRYSGVDAAKVAAGCTTLCTAQNPDPNAGMERYGHLKLATVNNGSVIFDKAVVPFPIQMFDAREGLYYDERSTTYYANGSYDNFQKVARNGVMSMVDIDVANLRRFLRGDFNGLFPIDTPFALANGGNGLRNSDVPDKNGWVLYVSDRRGDADFDGEFDMEDVYGAAPGNDGAIQKGEDINGNNSLDRSYGTEAERYRDNTAYPDLVAANDHKYYRRGVRLINGRTLPGIYDSTTPSNTKGFTVASENGVYIQGNYNATGVGIVPATGNTPYDQYLPFNTPMHIPASIVADGVTILSNAWSDARSFSTPYDQSTRVASDTTMRFAMISGDTIASKEALPHQGGISPRLNGGVHNFKRFLERWSGIRLDYAGSLINLWNSRNNNGSFKCCNTVYNPPRRNWVFDSTFLDPGRLPPATPYFQYVQTTGFQRTTD
jgi:hypothetical protein